MPTSALLRAILHAVPRRYRVSGPAGVLAPDDHAGALARLIERLHAVVGAGGAPETSWQDAFVTALDGLIREALRPNGGDPAFQAAVLAHRSPQVRAYLALRRQASADARKVRAAADAVAHPRKPARLPPGPARMLLAQLHAATTAGAWRQAAQASQALPAMSEIAAVEDLALALRTLRDDPALVRLCRAEALGSDPDVRRYESIRARLGPRAGSDEAEAQALLARQRGIAVEAMAARALEAVAAYLDRAAAPAAAPRYRVVTSLRVPAGLAADTDRAKTEWDAVLLRRADTAPLWDVCLVVEAKASVEAATTDLPRLLRGLRLLAGARPEQAYAFATQQGTIQVRGASLAGLPVTEAALADQVLYCCDAPADGPHAGLNAAGRMQLLSAPTCLAYAAALSQGQSVDRRDLIPLWQALRHDDRWRPVRTLAAMRQLARSLMVHPDDLLATVASASA